MSQLDLKNILISTVDSDVIILCIHFFERLELNELWVKFGVGKNVKYIAIHEIADSLGSVKCSGLLFFHAFSGCDTVSSFERHGKKSVWICWENFPSVNYAFSHLSTPQDHLDKRVLIMLEKFVLKMYHKDVVADTLDEGRKCMVFEKGCQPHQLPPTSAALKFHTLRALYQAGHVWGKSLLKVQSLPDPLQFGWKKKENQESYTPFWTNMKPASESILNKNCKCQNMSCTSNCGCKRSSLKCTSLCSCKGMCTQ